MLCVGSRGISLFAKRNVVSDINQLNVFVGLHSVVGSDGAARSIILSLKGLILLAIVNCGDKKIDDSFGMSQSC